MRAGGGNASSVNCVCVWCLAGKVWDAQVGGGWIPLGCSGFGEVVTVTPWRLSGTLDWGAAAINAISNTGAVFCHGPTPALESLYGLLPWLSVPSVNVLVTYPATVKKT